MKNPANLFKKKIPTEKIRESLRVYMQEGKRIQSLHHWSQRVRMLKKDFAPKEVVGLVSDALYAPKFEGRFKRLTEEYPFLANNSKFHPLDPHPKFSLMPQSPSPWGNRSHIAREMQEKAFKRQKLDEEDKIRANKMHLTNAKIMQKKN
eukprot:TRINITY_DN10448_c0_g1::TRINITY_DN10448_c0_g1_i1::g.15329::m.15329 TRINITY_DN10448_c0_g1::TRINITY_DN10448_c0_g1_i1::g.15329  ORF type:complete len:164 (-),score=19.83 TRINITY_DN10448_c0_g1_i1:47-493(-)